MTKLTDAAALTFYSFFVLSLDYDDMKAYQAERAAVESVR